MKPALDTTLETVESRGGFASALRRLPIDQLVLVFALAAVFAFFTVKSENYRFANAANISTIAQQTAIVGTAALGMTLMMAGLVFGFAIGIPGFLLFVYAFFRWALEPAS